MSQVHRFGGGVTSTPATKRCQVLRRHNSAFSAYSSLLLTMCRTPICKRRSKSISGQLLNLPIGAFWRIYTKDEEILAKASEQDEE